jgi:hypothetical protein
MCDSPNEFPKRLLCSWHVLKNFLKGATKAPKTQVKIINGMLMGLLYELDQDVALKKLADFKIYLEKPELKEVRSWFHSRYEHRFEMWGNAFRLHFGINTNMGTENLFRQIKMHSFDKKHVPRLDESIANITQFLKARINIYLNSQRYCSHQDTLRYNNHKKAVEIWRSNGFDYECD